jgi:hypothetical protein
LLELKEMSNSKQIETETETGPKEVQSPQKEDIKEDSRIQTCLDNSDNSSNKMQIVNENLQSYSGLIDQANNSVNESEENDSEYKKIEPGEGIQLDRVERAQESIHEDNQLYDSNEHAFNCKPFYFLFHLSCVLILYFIR